MLGKNSEEGNRLTIYLKCIALTLKQNLVLVNMGWIETLDIYKS